jgi:hypothetical protein
MPERRSWIGAFFAAWALAVAASWADGPIELRPRTEPWTAAEALAPGAREPGQRFALLAGTALGEIVVVSTWLDFRGQPIEPGRYGLRYALQPRLKEHVGADVIRDFALLVPLETEASADWQSESRAVSRTTHPAVMALVEWRGAGAPPSELREESPIRLVLFRTVGTATLGFVVLGRAPRPEL